MRLREVLLFDFFYESVLYSRLIVRFPMQDSRRQTPLKQTPMLLESPLQPL